MTAVTYVTFLLTRQYTKNPELCSLRYGDEFGLETGTGRLTMYYDSVEELGRLACMVWSFFSLRAGSLLNRVCSFYSYERSVSVSVLSPIISIYFVYASQRIQGRFEIWKQVLTIF